MSCVKSTKAQASKRDEAGQSYWFSQSRSFWSDSRKFGLSPLQDQHELSFCE